LPALAPVVTECHPVTQPILSPVPSAGERLLTVRRVAEVLSVTPQRVYQLIDSGALPSVRVGNSVRVPESALAPKS
jgi:excisionase family DNA binding protein